MPSFSLFSGVADAQLLSGGQTGYVGPNAAIGAGGMAAISANGNDIGLQVFGTVYTSNNHAILMSGGAARLVIGAGAIVSTDFSPVYEFGAVTLGPTTHATASNAGAVWSAGHGFLIRYNGFADTKVTLNNTGTINAMMSGIAAENGLVVINNSGLVRGEIYGIAQTYASATSSINLTNTGTISGGTAAIRMGTGADRITNYGEIRGVVEMQAGNDRLVNFGMITGFVQMGDGDDVYDGTGGTLIEGINMGAGNDRVIALGAAEYIDGGTGIDTIHFRGTEAVVFALDGSRVNAGAADGRDILGFENVIGSRSADAIYGNAAANELNGMAGADTLWGGAGADTIIGGIGADRLTGGIGNDVFRYGDARDFGDVINDFSGVAGNDDHFEFLWTAVGNLPLGTLQPGRFQSRADNVAQDGNDRFIFRTTDNTLWYDADGNRGIAPVMVADLQAGAVVTYSDIVII